MKLILSVCSSLSLGFEGKIVKEFLLSTGESKSLDTSDFRTGLYFYQLFSNEQTFETGKFLIQ